MVGCIMLNVTSRRQVDPVWEEFVETYVQPDDLVCISEAEREGLEELIKPLGMKRVRARRLCLMSSEYSALSLMCAPETFPVEMLPGCGRYAQESWRIFVNGDTDFVPQDKELKRYVEELA